MTYTSTTEMDNMMIARDMNYSIRALLVMHFRGKVVFSFRMIPYGNSFNFRNLW